MRQTLLGIVFLLAGLALLGVAILPLVPPPHTAHVALTVLILGAVLAVFGALLTDLTGAKAAITVIVQAAAPYIPRVGGRREGDPEGPPAPPGGAS